MVRMLFIFRKTPDNSIKVIINAERPDGQSKGFDGEVNEDGTVTVPLHSWMLEMEGSVICDISVIDTELDDNKKLTTTSFTLLVEKAAYGGSDVTNDPQYDVLVSLLETCQEASTVAQEALEKSNEANSKYDDCVRATESANQAANNANAVRADVEAGGYIESLKELNNNAKLTFWVGTQEEYESITEKTNNCFYIITDDTSFADYIVEQGTVEVEGITWTYEKWNSGKAICECNAPSTAGTGYKPDSTEISEQRIPVTFPFDFVEAPRIFTSYNYTGASAYAPMCIPTGAGDITESSAILSMEVRSYSYASNEYVFVATKVVGKWK